MHRFFESQDLNIEQEILLNSNNSHKIISVLKLSLNSNISIFNNTEEEFYCKIIQLNKKTVKAKILKKISKTFQSPLKIHLAHAIAKNHNMDWVIQKSVELGVNAITPIITQRTVVKPKDYQQKLIHWQAIAVAACCQCGLNLIPKINPIVSYSDFITRNAVINQNYKFILDPLDHEDLQLDNPIITYPSKFKISEQLKHILTNFDYSQSITILIGSEGGFSKEELYLANTNGFNKLHLGPRILRTETAPIVILSILQEKLGDL